MHYNLSPYMLVDRHQKIYLMFKIHPKVLRENLLVFYSNSLQCFHSLQYFSKEWAKLVHQHDNPNRPTPDRPPTSGYNNEVTQ